MNTEGSLAKLITAKCKEWLLKTNKSTGEAILKKKKPLISSNNSVLELLYLNKTYVSWVIGGSEHSFIHSFHTYWMCAMGQALWYTTGYRVNNSLTLLVKIASVVCGSWLDPDWPCP